MKKVLALLTASLALVVFINSANAQTAVTTKESKSTSISNAKGTNAVEAKEQKSSSHTATKTAMTPEQKKEQLQNDIKSYERKIEANRNNPKFDLKAAEAELARLKSEAGEK